MSLIHRILSRVTDRFALGAVIVDIKTLATDFESSSFSFSSRKMNVVAHTLARNAESLVCNISVGVAPGHFVMMLFDRCRPHSLKEKECTVKDF
jgi:hypothetical protein